MVRFGSVSYLLAGRFRRMSWAEQGDPAAPVLLCVHGLSRNGRDFDVLGAALADRYRVIAPDLPGRGASDWLEAGELYQPANYVTALAHLLARFDAPVDYIGTSLGGICGMAIAAMPGQPIRRLVLNDIGPHIPLAGLARIGSYVQRPAGPFADVRAAEAHLRNIHASFGALSDAHWAAMAEHSVRALPDGGFALHYDPLMVAQMAAAPTADVDLWGLWNAIDCPVLTLRGESSDLLLEKTVAEMAAKSQVLTVPGAGHAPALMDAPTIAVIRAFFVG